MTTVAELQIKTDYHHNLRSASAWKKVGRATCHESTAIQVRKTERSDLPTFLPIVEYQDNGIVVVATDFYYLYSEDQTNPISGKQDREKPEPPACGRRRPTLRAGHLNEDATHIKKVAGKPESRKETTLSYTPSSTVVKSSPPPSPSLRWLKPSEKRRKPLRHKGLSAFQKAEKPFLRNYLPEGFKRVEIAATARRCLCLRFWR
jgi:hypothetical protein